MSWCSLAGFAVIMRQAATELGMSGPLVLNDPAGLDGKEGFQGGNLLSAWDVAIAARDLMANPTLASIVTLKHYRFTGPDRIVYDLSNKNLYFLNTYHGVKPESRPASPGRPASVWPRRRCGGTGPCSPWS